MPLTLLAADLQALGHWLRVHPVRSAVGVAAVLLLAALTVIVWRWLQERRALGPENSSLDGLRRLALGRFARTAALLALAGGAGTLATSFAYRGYRDVAVRENVDAAELGSNSTFGIDLSHYQARVNWDAVAKSDHPIKFVFLRATMGFDAVDGRFRENWIGAGEAGFIRGAYHYFRPGEDGKAQFDNFARTVDLQTGDLYPVLDIETMSRRGPEQLRLELQEWLDLAESRWGVKPILYTGQTFYRYHLAGHFDDYPLWLAHYSATPDTAVYDWRIHQFTDRVRVKGILDRVDGNNFRGTVQELGGLRL